MRLIIYFGKKLQRPLKTRGGVIIIEDDVSFSSDFLSAVEECIDSNWECVRLFVIDSLPKRKRIIKNFWTSKRGGGGTQGYFIRKSAAKKFLNASRYWLHPVDLFMDRYWQHGVAYVFRVPYGVQDKAAGSEIDFFDGRKRTSIKRNLVFCPARYIFRLVDKIKKRIVRKKYSVMFWGTRSGL